MNRNQTIVLLVLAVAAGTLTVPVQAQELPSAGWIARETAEAYRVQARYPSTSWAATEDWDPGIRRTPSRITVTGREAESTTLTVWPAQVAFQGNTPIDLFASLTDPRGRTVAGTISGEVADASGHMVAKMQFFDDGVAADTVAGDGRYSARVTLPERSAGARAESFLVRITSLARNESAPRYATTSFQRSWPGATLTGRFRDRIRADGLAVSAQVVVKLPGRYHLTASLVTADGAPIGAAQNAAQLEPGTHWVDLAFYGLMFHERATSGSFQVEAITLTDTSSMPNALGPVVEDAHRTHAYALSRFTAEPFGGKALLEAASRLDAEAARAAAQR